MDIRHNWTEAEVRALYTLPFMELIYQAHTVHRHYFNDYSIQLSSLLSIKTGACPEDCAYCPQSGHYHTELKKEKLLDKETVLNAAAAAKQQGATRFCMGAAWKYPPAKDFPKVLEMVTAVKAMGLETCVTLGKLNAEQAQLLKESGLDFYNHNLDTSLEFYKKIISTRTYEERLETLSHVREADIKICCGGILGMGESELDRLQLLIQLANLDPHPESVPINHLMAVKGTPLQDQKPVAWIEFIKIIALARIMIPKSYVRLSAGRELMNEQMQALCFFAGANSIFCGEKLLTTPNPAMDIDQQLLKKLDLQVEQDSI